MILNFDALHKCSDFQEEIDNDFNAPAASQLTIFELAKGYSIELFRLQNSSMLLYVRDHQRENVLSYFEAIETFIL